MTENPKHILEIRTASPDRPSKITKIEDSNGGGETEQQEQQQQQDTSSEAQIMSQKHGLQRYLVAIEYIGTRFSGSQQQSNCRTVVGTLEDAFHKFIGQPVSIFCSSRTDAGVHALSNVCHVDVERISKRKPGEVLPPHEPAVVKNAVNHFLLTVKAARKLGLQGARSEYLRVLFCNYPSNHLQYDQTIQRKKNCDDVMVTDVRPVPPDFHARYKAQERTYFYRLLSGPEQLSTLERNRAWHVPEELDLLAMQAACKVLVGQHDFSSFRATGCQANSPIRTLEELNVSEVAPTPYFPSPTERGQNKLTDSDDQVSGSIDGRVSDVGFGIRKKHRCFVVTARARSFLYHQVRLLVGVLKAVGTGHLTISDVERILNAKTVTAASAMAPASGLYLGHVKYDLP